MSPVPLRRGLLAAGLLSLLPLSGCIVIPLRDPLRVQVAGIEPLPGEGLEWRFGVKLRLQNPNEAAADFSGVFVDLEVRGQPFGSGVTDARGSVPGFGEVLLTVPVTVPVVNAVRQALDGAAAGSAALRRVDYRLRGKVGGGLIGERRFETRGELSLPGPR